MGIEGLFSSKQSISASYTAEIKDNVTQNMATDFKIVKTVTCTPREGDVPGVGLWQWVVSSHDGTT